MKNSGNHHVRWRASAVFPSIILLKTHRVLPVEAFTLQSQRVTVEMLAFILVSLQSNIHYGRI